MVFILAATLLIMMTGTVGATPLPVNGSLPCFQNGSGCLNGSSSVQVIAGNCINFYNSNTPDGCDASLSATDKFNEIASSDIATFGPLNQTGTMKDLIFATPFATVLSFATIGPVTFDLTGVVSPSTAPCPISGSPTACSAGIFSLTQDGSTVDVGFTFTANACTNGSTTTGCTASGGSTFYTMGYTTQLPNETILDVINKSGTPPNFIFNSVSLTALPVPEPAAFLLVGAGLLAISLVTRRRRSRA